MKKRLFIVRVHCVRRAELEVEAETSGDARVIAEREVRCSGDEAIEVESCLPLFPGATPKGKGRR